MSDIDNHTEKRILDLEAQIQRLKAKINMAEIPVSQLYEDLFNRICSLLSVGYFLFDPVKQEIQTNNTIETIFENCVPSIPFTVNELIESAHSEDQEFLKDLFSGSRIQKKKINGQFRLTYRAKDVREIKTFIITGSYEDSDIDNPVLTCVIRDITKESKQIRDLQKNLERAEESDRIKTIFLLNISHNIRTPMNSILGFAELLHLTKPSPDRRNEYIQTIKRQSQNLLQLIDDVSEIAKFESGIMTITKTPVNLNLLLNEVIRDVESIRTLERKESVKILYSSSSASGVTVYTDAGRLYQIFMNLINHSLKFTSKGSIEIGYTLPSDNRINFFVKDSSDNLDKNALKILFEKYTRKPEDNSDRYDDESQLNLAIARSIVKLLGGRINFNYEEGMGCTFNFVIPYEEPPEIKTEIPEEELAFQQQYKWKNKVILLVEDEEVNGIFLEAVLHETGAKTLYAKNGRQAVDLCKSINKIDLILMDIRMPVMNGLKATEEIRKFNQSIPIIAQTALTLEEDRDECLRAGCNDTIIKPIEIEELLKLINKYISH